MTIKASTESTPRFTVIIPSKNRAKFLYHTLRTCMMQEYERLEVIVSDDGSTENNREVVDDASRRDPRIRYVQHVTGSGMRDNFEFALRQVKPGFVIALGGDDGLLPDGIQGMRDVLRETGTELLAWPAPVYSYPGVHGPNGQLSIYRQRGVKTLDAREFLARQATRLHYLSDIESPMLYVKGVASTELVDRVRARSPDGRFFSCATPDGYSGIVLAGEVSRYAFSGKPLSVYGLSPSSQGLAYLSNDDEAKRRSAAFINAVASRPMHRELASQPYSPLISLMTVDYLLTAKELPGWPGTVPPIDYRQLLVKAIDELGHGLYGEARVGRELTILNNIAEHHGLGEYFRSRVRGARRARTREHFHGSGINRSAVFLDGKTYNLRNIVDAAYAVQFFQTAFSELTLSGIVGVFARSLRYRLRAMKRGGPFPPESTWPQVETAAASVARATAEG